MTNETRENKVWKTHPDVEDLLRIVTAILRINFNHTIGNGKKKLLFLSFEKNKEMIQRIQTVYLALAFLVTGALPYVFPLWTIANKPYYFMENMVYVLLFGLSTVLSLLAIFFYNKRQHQFVIGRLNILSNVILFGLLAYRTLTVSGGAPAPEKGIGLLLPIVAIVFVALANKAIKRDEELVKSADRLR